MPLPGPLFHRPGLPSLRRAGVWGSAPAGAGGARLNRSVAAMPPPLRGLLGLPGALAGRLAARCEGGRVQFAGVEGLLVSGRRPPADRPEQPLLVKPADPGGSGRLHLARSRHGPWWAM